MSNLYILGAGCSRNYSQSKHRIQGLKSPLNRDFFKMARLVVENTGMKSDPLFMEEIDILIKTIAPLYGSSKNDLSFFDNPYLNLEDVMTLLDIDFKLFSPLASPKSGQRESRQLRALKDLLARTLDYALMGPPCKKHHALAERMELGDVVLSFNYDILIDNALFNLGKTTDYGYRMDLFKVNQDGEWMRPDERTSEVTLLKLHGSLNWVRCGFCGALLLYRYRKQALYGAQVFQCPRCSSDKTYAERMMIPPIQSKDYRDRDIAFLWVQADRMMKDFSQIICIGYSFSPLDFDMISLVRRFRTRQIKTPEVDFVSPDSEAEKRLKVFLGVEKVRRFNDLSSYLKSTE
jgi:NAD-dependent SIR2 family protein deacetylase